MIDSRNSSYDPDPGLWLKNWVIELVSASNKLYGNGRQQTAIRVRVEIQPKQPPLTQEQKDSMRLVLENFDGSYEILPPPGLQESQWTQTPIRDENFDLMPGSTVSARRDDQEDSDHIFAIVMFVSTTVVGAQTATLRAMIRRDADTVYYSDGSSNFNRSVEVTTIAPPIFEENDYAWTLSHTAGNIDNKFLHEYRLQLKGLGLAPLAVDMNPGMIRWHYNRQGETYATYVGMAHPGNDRTVRYKTEINTGSSFRPSQTAITNNQNALILVLNGADDIPFYSGGLVHDTPCKVRIIDRHGNEHEIMFAFSEEGSPIEKRTDLKISYS
ncbi:hypothetical protein IAE35_11080 [Pseudomonas sp. S75]|uniref:hypothetical protein n=1 Tax=unclassified Pseudomonas TaxID=196821 RepID=UPI00190761CE|nr:MULTISPECIES: hypothetical protein [unclassified Pseudomonas]MBJ9976844.1 hypothetical protein [Pseudomonas sp. S30]MBK0153881.1 hypothetical protein [Pseudomonas sp. S75]